MRQGVTQDHPTFQRVGFRTSAKALAAFSWIALM
jgi:hypothetical protein